MICGSLKDQQFRILDIYKIINHTDNLHKRTAHIVNLMLHVSINIISSICFSYVYVFNAKTAKAA